MNLEKLITDAIEEARRLKEIEQKYYHKKEKNLIHLGKALTILQDELMTVPIDWRPHVEEVIERIEEVLYS